MRVITWSSAVFSDCKAYRYALWRKWESPNTGYAVFIGLNPSTADETNDDPTIKRCIKFADDWGYSGLCMLNLFAFRATDPKVMLRVADPVGRDNDEYIRRYVRGAGVAIAAWGARGTHMGRDRAVREMIPSLHYLRLTKDGHPGHPLYLPAELRPVRMNQELVGDISHETE